MLMTKMKTMKTAIPSALLTTALLPCQPSALAAAGRSGPAFPAPSPR